MNWSQAVHQLHEEQIPFVVVTMAEAKGHNPQDPGAKAVITRDGLFAGTVGGGKLEALCIRRAQKLLAAPADPKTPKMPTLHTWNLQRDIGMSCGGEVTMLFEVFRTEAWKIAIFGAGHCAQALVRTLLPLQCQITLLDTRHEWIDKLPKTAKLTIRHSDDLPAQVATLPKDTYLVVMTQGHTTDFPILLEALRLAHFPYVGVLGSNVKALKIFKELELAGIPSAQISQLHCPIGLPFGNNSPEEIAISVAAQLISVRGT